jgi:hypothetical protein
MADDEIGCVEGYPDGTFFVVVEEEVPFSTEIALLAAEAGIDLETQPNAMALRRAIAEAMLAFARVEAPEHLAELGLSVTWRGSDQRELEAAYERRVRLVDGFTRVLERQLRSVPRSTTALRCVPLITVLSPMPAAGLIDGWALHPPRQAIPPPAPGPERPSSVPAPASMPGPVPSSATLKAVEEAVVAARESELPQRLPGGARRRLQRLPPGAYVASDEKLEPCESLAASLIEAQAASRRDREMAVISWDGEWPVVVRRYGDGGRTIYRVEDALRRAGVESTQETGP